ncbi:MAG: sulfurtransferase [Anaerolineales bacterium]|nr:sulfurtransferase [Anaerolineales bacterium]
MSSNRIASEEYSGGQSPPEPAPPPHPLIEVEGLRALRDESWRLLDCRFDLEDPEWGRRVYRESHIPGASYVGLERDLSGSLTGENGRHPLPEISELEALFSRLGIGSHNHVVAYDASGGPYAARAWWTLRYLGHDLVQVLNGGFPAWQRAELPTESGENSVPSADFVADPRPEMRAPLDEIRSSLNQAQVQLIDARAPERYRGEQEPYDPVAGRIPGALNHHWKENLGARGEFLPPSKLHQKIRGSLQGKVDGEHISYCGSGVTAAHNILALRAAGLPEPRLYVGSWSEWCADDDRPIERNGG